MSKRKEPYVRVRVPDVLLPLPRKGFLACVGVGLKPWHRCHWQAIAQYKTAAAADARLGGCDSQKGRAVFDLSNPRLQIVDEDGKLRQCAEIRDTLLS